MKGVSRLIPALLVVWSAGCEAPSASDSAVPAERARNQVCGTATWHPNTLEVHHIDIGQGDSTLIVSPTGRTLLIDAGEPHWDRDTGAQIIGRYVRSVLGCSRLDYVLITHFHVDHIGYPEIGGLWNLVNTQHFAVGKMLHRNADDYLGDTSSTYSRWRDYLATPAARSLLHPEIVHPGADQIDLGPGVTFTIIGADGDGALEPGDFSTDTSPPNENDYSVASLLRFGAFDYFIGGDLSGEFAPSTYGYAYHDIESHLARQLPDVDVYRVNHHGSEHSSSPTFLAQIAPEVSIISAGDGNPYGHPSQETLARLLAQRSTVYSTERGAAPPTTAALKVTGHVTVRTVDGLTYTVNTDTYRATDPPRVDDDHDGYFLESDPDDTTPVVKPLPRGGCDRSYQSCNAS